ncbi:MAG: sulfite exporter TauE/SafE family protein [Steroidobacteraceae bacterium]
MNGFDASHLGPWAALLAGLAGSGHCLAMCGGISGALAMRGAAGDAAAATFGVRLWTALAYNGARVASYALAGGLAGGLGRTLLRAVDVAPLSVALRVVAGLVMIAAAGRLLFGWRLLDPLEAGGSALWRRILPSVSPRARGRGGLGGALTLGFAWGWLPCGLTYSMLLLAATTASVPTGAAVMAAFGLGTLPSMVAAAVTFDRAARLLASRATLRTVAGSLLLAFGAWTVGNAAYHALAHTHGAHAMHAEGGAGSGGAMPVGHPAGHVMTRGMDMNGADATPGRVPADPAAAPR